MKKRIESMLLAVCMFLSIVTLLFSTSSKVQAEEAVDARYEITEERTANSDTWFIPSENNYETIVYSEDKYYLNEQNAYEEINNTLIEKHFEADGENYTYVNAANSTKTYYSAEKPVVLLTTAEQQFAFSAKGAQPGTVLTGGDCSVVNKELGELGGKNSILYKDAFNHTDLLYKTVNGGVKEYIILNSPQAGTEFSFEFLCEGYIPKTLENGTVLFNGLNGDSFSLGSLFAVDANGAYTDQLFYELEETDGEHVTVKIRISEDYLSASERAWPVIIDPTVTVNGATVTYDTYVSSKWPYSNYYTNNYLRTGKDTNSGIRRSYLKFDIPSSISASALEAAYVRIAYQSGPNPTVRAWRVTDSWSSSSLTWNTMPGHESSYVSYITSQSDGWYYFYDTEGVENWLEGSEANYGWVLIDTNESNEEHWTTFYSSDASSGKPELHITHSGSSETYYSVSYNGNGQTSGSAPAGQFHTAGASLTLRNNTGNLAKTGYTFSGWSTTADGSGQTYNAGGSYVLPSNNITLYAKWKSARVLNVEGYVDGGYQYRFSNPIDSVESYQSVVESVLERSFNVDVVFCTPETFSSSADQCMTSQSMSYNQFIPATCSHSLEDDHITRTAIYEGLEASLGAGDSRHCYVAWTGHILPGNPVSVNFTNNHYIVITPCFCVNSPSYTNKSAAVIAEKSAYVLCHELGHEIGAHDHYCYGSRNDNSCGNPYCYYHAYHYNSPPNCVMTSHYNIQTMSVPFCTDCQSNVETHLADHH